MTSSSKILIQMSGAPGSGKSTVAKLLARVIDASIVNHDLLKSFFLDQSVPFHIASQITYKLNWVLAEDFIKQGRSVIMDSPCNYSEIIDSGSQLAEKYEYKYVYVECKVIDIDLLDHRLRERSPLRSQRTSIDSPPRDANRTADHMNGRELFKRWIENPHRPMSNIIVVDSSGSPHDCVQEILNQLNL